MSPASSSEAHLLRLAGLEKGRANKRSRCPVCKETSLLILEARPVDGGHTRRRKKCDHCGHRLTTYEVSAENFTRMRRLEALLDQLDTISQVVEDFKNQGTCPCASCSLADNGACTLSLPEYDTVDAHGCTYFKRA